MVLKWYEVTVVRLISSKGVFKLLVSKIRDVVVGRWVKFCVESKLRLKKKTLPYSQTRIKCSQPISSPRGLQGQKIFADAIIKILISTKSISDKNSYDQLFINEVVKIFTFQFDEGVIKFYVAKVLSILMKLSKVEVKYHKIFLVGTRKKITSINFPGGRKN